MSNEWRELKTLQDVAAAMDYGDEIEVGSDHVGAEWDWYKWDGEYWASDSLYRARPRPKTKKVKMLCWFINGHLNWLQEGNHAAGPDWRRVPSEDKEIEVEEK